MTNEELVDQADEEIQELLDWIDERIKFNAQMQMHTKGIAPEEWKQEGKRCYKLKQLLQSKRTVTRDEVYDLMWDVSAEIKDSDDVIRWLEKLGIEVIE